MMGHLMGHGGRREGAFERNLGRRTSPHQCARSPLEITRPSRRAQLNVDPRHSIARDQRPLRSGRGARGRAASRALNEFAVSAGSRSSLGNMQICIFSKSGSRGERRRDFPSW